MRLRRRAHVPELRAAQDPGDAEDADHRFRGRVLKVRSVAKVRGAIRPRRPLGAGGRETTNRAGPVGRLPGGRHRARLFAVRHVRRRPLHRAARCRPVRHWSVRGPGQSVRSRPETVVHRRQTPEAERQRLAGL